MIVVVFLAVAVTQQKFGGDVVQFIFAQDLKYLNIPLRMTRETAREQVEQRCVRVHVAFQV
jgi:hypothetical protein